MIKRRAVTAALKTLLESTGRPVGLGHMPPQAQPPYFILYDVDSSVSGAPFADENEDLSVVYQVTTVSGPDSAVQSSAGSLDQAEFWADKAREAILRRDPATGQWASPLAVAGARVMCRELETEPGGTSDATDGIISYVQRFRFDLTPA